MSEQSIEFGGQYTLTIQRNGGMSVLDDCGDLIFVVPKHLKGLIREFGEKSLVSLFALQEVAELIKSAQRKSA